MPSVFLLDVNRDGEGVPQEKKKSIEFFQRASDMGDADEMINLGIS